MRVYQVSATGTCNCCCDSGHPYCHYSISDSILPSAPAKVTGRQQQTGRLHSRIRSAESLRWGAHRTTPHLRVPASSKRRTLWTGEDPGAAMTCMADMHYGVECGAQRGCLGPSRGPRLAKWSRHTSLATTHGTRIHTYRAAGLQHHRACTPRNQRASSPERFVSVRQGSHRRWSPVPGQDRPGCRPWLTDTA